MSNSITSSYTNMCFVIMPFGEKDARDFDDIYETIFEAAIKQVQLPDGSGALVPKRADTGKGLITDEMFKDILYARIVLADITLLNPNVFYELGVRHALRPTSTVVFRDESLGKDIPFDIQDLRINWYNLEGGTGGVKALDTIKKALQETLTNDESEIPESPVKRALKNDLEWPEYDSLLKPYRFKSRTEIERLEKTVQEYLRIAYKAETNRIDEAIANCRGARKLILDHQLIANSLEVNMFLAELLKNSDRFEEAQEILREVIEDYPDYGNAQRELGVVMHKNEKVPSDQAIKPLEKAIELNPYDLDARASLGGVYKDLKQYGKAQEAYEEARELDPQNSYALLNCLTMRAVNSKTLPSFKGMENTIEQIVERLKREAENETNLPWCLYDLAQIHFLQGNIDAFNIEIEEAIDASKSKSQVKTAYKTYLLLKNVGEFETNINNVIERINKLADEEGWELEKE